ncbi:MAG: hypothetical protein LGB67_00870 [Sulfurovum sp.]|nr:hypothetical protein [Sulfurovum sp.]
MHITNIEKSQQEYFDLIKSFEEQVYSEDIDQQIIAMILDEILCFWLDKKDILRIELENFTSQRNCVILSGAVYLDIRDNEHYIFKALGEEHIISDPLLKLEPFFRVPSHIFNQESIEFFRRAFRDTMSILAQVKNSFFILPIKVLAINDEQENYELLQKFFLNFINTALDEDFEQLDNFFPKYSTYDEIEKNMTPFFKSNLTFDESNDQDLSLEEKIEGYIDSHNIMRSLTKDKSEAEKFILSLQNYVTQISDILITAVLTGVTPFIRSKPTFHYLTIVMYTFIEDENFKNMIEKSIVYYIFHNTVNKDNLVQIDFNEFMKISREHQFLDSILEEMRDKEINIFDKGVDQVSQIIEDKFCRVINNVIKEEK